MVSEFVHVGGLRVGYLIHNSGFLMKFDYSLFWCLESDTNNEHRPYEEEGGGKGKTAALSVQEKPCVASESLKLTLYFGWGEGSIPTKLINFENSRRQNGAF